MRGFRFGVVVIAVFVVNVSGFAVVVRATGAVDVSGFAVRRARRDFTAENEEGGDASDEQERERADGDEGRRGFRLIVVVLQFGHFGILGLSLILNLPLRFGSFSKRGRRSIENFAQTEIKRRRKRFG